ARAFAPSAGADAPSAASRRGLSRKASSVRRRFDRGRTHRPPERSRGGRKRDPPPCNSTIVLGGGGPPIADERRPQNDLAQSPTRLPAIVIVTRPDASWRFTTAL